MPSTNTCTNLFTTKLYIQLPQEFCCFLTTDICHRSLEMIAVSSRWDLLTRLKSLYSMIQSQYMCTLPAKVRALINHEACTCFKRWLCRVAMFTFLHWMNKKNWLTTKAESKSWALIWSWQIWNDHSQCQFSAVDCNNFAMNAVSMPWALMFLRNLRFLYIGIYMASDNRPVLNSPSKASSDYFVLCCAGDHSTLLAAEALMNDVFALFFKGLISPQLAILTAQAAAESLAMRTANGQYLLGSTILDWLEKLTHLLNPDEACMKGTAISLVIWQINSSESRALPT